MKKYDSYKDSGVQWIGEIPSHWGYSIVGRHFEIERGRVISKIEIEDNKGEFPVYSSQTTNNGELGKINTYDFEGEYVTWTTDGVHTGTCFFRKGKFNTTNVCGMLSIRNTPYSLPFLSFFLNQVTKPYVRIDINPKLMNNMMSEIPLVLPPLHEQQQIVQFLDIKTSLIDSLIDKTQLKIELLKEKRTSLINHVVTKGLNPNVEMIDSGVEWIGEIPIEWDNPFFGLISNLQQGLQIPFDNRFFEYEDGMFEYITTKSVHNPNDTKQYVLNPKKSVICSKDEILYGRTGNTGEVVTNVNGVFHNNFFKIEYRTDLLNKEYLIYFLTNSRFRETILLLSGTTTIPDLNHGDFNSCRCLIPPLSEQQQIVEYLDEQTQTIDTTITKEQKRIELLKEYRQSLISEVVTGKIKVTTDD
jgi:type I restriction enzyme, S subunit